MSGKAVRGLTARQEEARVLAVGLMRQWGLTGWEFRFNNRKRGMGLCRYPWPTLGLPGRLELSVHFVERNPADVVRDTILHEIAHALSGPRTGHGPQWRRWCGVVGANPERQGQADMPPGRWRATCPSCQTVYNRHRRPKGAGYYCPDCGRDRGRLSFTPHD